MGLVVHDKAVTAAPRELKIRYTAGQTERGEIRYIAGRKEYEMTIGWQDDKNQQVAYACAASYSRCWSTHVLLGESDGVYVYTHALVRNSTSDSAINFQ